MVTTTTVDTEVYDRVARPYRLYAKLSVYRRRVRQSLEIIRKSHREGKPFVAYSGGKDSQVVFHLANQVAPTPGVLFDSGCESPFALRSVECMRELGLPVTVMPPVPLPPEVAPNGERGIVDMLRLAGMFGSESPTGEYWTWFKHEWKKWLLEEPARIWREQSGCDITILGLRKDENRGRKIALNKHGSDYVRKDGLRIICPLANWTGMDVFAYLFSNNLPVSEEYLDPDDSHQDRERRRTGTLLGTTGKTYGRFQEVRRKHPALWQELIATFPELARYG